MIRGRSWLHDHTRVYPCDADIFGLQLSGEKEMDIPLKVFVPKQKVNVSNHDASWEKTHSE